MSGPIERPNEWEAAMSVSTWAPARQITDDAVDVRPEVAIPPGGPVTVVGRRVRGGVAARERFAAVSRPALRLVPPLPTDADWPADADRDVRRLAAGLRVGGVMRRRATRAGSRPWLGGIGGSARAESHRRVGRRATAPTESRARNRARPASPCVEAVLSGSPLAARRFRPAFESSRRARLPVGRRARPAERGRPMHPFG